MSSRMAAPRYLLLVLAMVAIAALALVAGLYLGPHRRVVPASTRTVVEARDLRARVPPVSATPLADPAPQPPARLVVQSIGVDAMVEPVGVDAQNFMGLPSKSADV